jgi:hypothetical protein
LRIHDDRGVEIGKRDDQDCKREVVPEALNVGKCSVLRDERRNEHQRLSEDDRHHVGGIEFQGDVLTYTAVLLVTYDTLGILNRNLAHGLHQSDSHHEDQSEEYQLDDEHDKAAAVAV